MRRIGFAVCCLLVAPWALGVDALRVGSQLLVSGDTAAQVRDVLGKPAYVSHRRDSGRRARRGITVKQPGAVLWEYRRDGHIITVTLVDGRVTDFEDRVY